MKKFLLLWLIIAFISNLVIIIQPKYKHVVIGFYHPDIRFVWTNGLFQGFGNDNKFYIPMSEQEITDWEEYNYGHRIIN